MLISFTPKNYDYRGRNDVENGVAIISNCCTVIFTPVIYSQPANAIAAPRVTVESITPDLFCNAMQ
jgi:hypothetical protein